jgi:hypothetical protein
MLGERFHPSQEIAPIIFASWEVQRRIWKSGKTLSEHFLMRYEGFPK